METMAATPEPDASGEGGTWKKFTGRPPTGILPVNFLVYDQNGGDAEGRPGLDCLTRRPLTRGGPQRGIYRLWGVTASPFIIWNSAFRLLITWLAEFPCYAPSPEVSGSGVDDMEFCLQAFNYLSSGIPLLCPLARGALPNGWGFHPAGPMSETKRGGKVV
jgi:hypothetical protein